MWREIIREFWWLLALAVLGWFFINLSQSYAAKKKKDEAKKKEVKDWVILQARVNREILQTPKAMEQVFNGFHVIGKGYISLELVGMGRELYFMIRAPRAYRNLVESQFYAQYPEAEINTVEDHFSSLPALLPNRDYDLWGTEIVLEKDSYYPIRTYSYFEESKEEKRIDPMSSFAESIAKLQHAERFVLEIMIKPLTEKEEEKFIKGGRSAVDKMLGKKAKIETTWQDWVASFFKNLITGIFEPLTWPTSEGGEPGSAPSLSFGDKDVMSGIENKISRLSFQTTIRLVYISPKSIFNESNVSAFMAFLNQFGSKGLNAFKISKDSSTVVKQKLWPNRKLFLKKENFYQDCLQRRMEDKGVILSSEELATVYHFPALKVSAPALKRVLSKKGEPPAGLPVE